MNRAKPEFVGKFEWRMRKFFLSEEIDLIESHAMEKESPNRPSHNCVQMKSESINTLAKGFLHTRLVGLKKVMLVRKWDRERRRRVSWVPSSVLPCRCSVSSLTLFILISPS